MESFFHSKETKDTTSSKEGKSYMPSWLRPREAHSDIPLSDIPPAVSSKQLEDSLTHGIKNSLDESKTYDDVKEHVKVALNWLNQNRDKVQANTNIDYQEIKIAEGWYNNYHETTNQSDVLKNASYGILKEIQRAEKTFYSSPSDSGDSPNDDNH